MNGGREEGERNRGREGGHRILHVTLYALRPGFRVQRVEGFGCRETPELAAWTQQGLQQ
jgi:hypothetical protein